MKVSDLTTRTDNLSLSEMDISSSDDITTAKVANDTGKSLEKCDRTEPMMEVSDLSAGTDNLSLSEMKISLSDDIATPKVTNDTGKSLEECDATEPIGVLYRDKYRAFLTHSDIDAEFVESVMDTLEKRGISCCYSKKDFRPGTSTVSCINEAMDRSKFVICFLSKDFLTSPWCKHEREMALHKAAETSEDIIVPILMDASLEDLPMNMRRLTHIRHEDIDFEKKLFFSLGFQEGNSRPTYDDLEAANAKLNTELEDAKKVIKQQQMHIEQCKAEVSQQESAMAAMKQYCHDRQQRLDTRDGEVKVMKTKLDHCLNEKDENKQQERSDSALTTTVEDLPEMHEDDIQTLSTVSRNVVGRFRRPLTLGEKYAKESRWQDVINSLKVAERILKMDTNNSIPERMVFQMFKCLWKAYRNLKDYQASINYCNEALSYQHKLFGPGCINKDVASCYHSCALAHELWGKLDDAIELYSTSVIYRRILCAINDRGGVSREKLGLSLRFLGRTYSKKGDMEASSKYLNMALEEEIKLHGQDETHPNIKKIRSLLDKTKHT